MSAQNTRTPNCREPVTFAVRWELIQPRADALTRLDAYRKLVALGEMAWNWAVEPADRPRPRLEDSFRRTRMPYDSQSSPGQSSSTTVHRGPQVSRSRESMRCGTGSICAFIVSG